MKLSYFDIEMACDDLTISDHFLEVISVTPQELHHLFEPGIVPYILSAIRETIGEKSKSTNKKFVDKFFSGTTKHFLDRKSERDYIHMSNRDGFWNIGNLLSMEHGDFQGITIFMHTRFRQCPETILPCNKCQLYAHV